MRTIVILGGSSSIGKAIFNQFNKKDNKIISTYFSEGSPANTAKNNELFCVDLDNNKSIIEFSEKLISEKITIDVLISLAGILPGKNLLEYTFEEIDKVLSINFTGQAKLIRNIIPLLSTKSKLLLMSSISGQKGSYDPFYSASKGALLSFVKSVLPSLPTGATINAIAPGLIQDSAMFKNMTFDRQESHKKQVNSGKLLNQDDLAKIIYDLCQDHWNHLNGACIDLNGGQYVR
jgi:NAD(P)-dependent dehydrogenase (short-subunit alcohol dehydrogenase family)